MSIPKDKILGGLFGLCVGDALGTPVEFTPREELKRKPIRDMTGGGIHGQPPGTWSDDSSLALCLAESLCHGFNLEDMAQRFVKWLYEGYWTPHGEVFDTGRTVKLAIAHLKRGVPPLEAGIEDEHCNGNGSLMRILPLAFHLKGRDTEEQFEKAHQVSCITHRHPRSQMACAIYIQMAVNLLSRQGLQESYENMRNAVIRYYRNHPYECELEHFKRILNGDLPELPEREIRTSGYVVDTLEACLWCLLNNRGFAETVLAAVNLGYDSDTTGAITGGLAGIHYGYKSIPESWIRKIARSDEIRGLGMRLYRALKLGKP